MTLLAIDVGRGTQDILVYDPGRPVENCGKMVLPAPTVVVGQRIREAAAKGEGIFLDGFTMGGGGSVQAVSEHLRRGSPSMQRMAGESMLPMLHGTSEVVHGADYVMGWELFAKRGLRKGDWKIIYEPHHDARTVARGYQV